MKSEWRALKTLQSLANARKSSVINTGKKSKKLHAIWIFHFRKIISLFIHEFAYMWKKIITTNDHYMN